ncbi:hypothetical protein GCM10009801_68120 [Streptomyces albiaxialis]|uniref:Fe2OG dioxygenase domain-containing protein n=1 Tax=Streptomyces albiaxialis TaxID=329523 RepID=A0ABP5ICW8_9ACTN
MIHVSETVALQTVEDFLTEEESAQLVKIMDLELGASGWRPRHQADVLPAPAAALQILHQATERALPAVRRTMPSITAALRWGYTELRPGDRVPTHLDGIPDPGSAPRRIGRIGVTLTDAEEGGVFYVATTSSGTPWTARVLRPDDGYQAGTPLARSLPHEAAYVREHLGESSWIAETPKSHWHTDAPARTAVAYGAQLMHGVTPVRRGMVRKFVADLADGAPPDAAS